MEGAFLPLFLDMKGRACLLVGAGEELLRKGDLLLQAGARLRLVAPQEMVALWPETHQGRIDWLGTTFSPDHLEGVWLVVSTHANDAINRTIRREAEARGVFVNVVDQPEFCSAIWPALIRRSPVAVAISTGGTGPALSGWLRQKIAEQLPDNLGEMALWFSQWRKKMAPALSSLEERGRFWRHLFACGLLDRYARGDRLGAEQMILEAAQQREKKDRVQE
ncbi:MAG: hypothetical protein HQL77_02225 [Magnetococcales bacterium]|nr:hypothetical protein [Magnetococcales bacterium]